MWTRDGYGRTRLSEFSTINRRWLLGTLAAAGALVALDGSATRALANPRFTETPFSLGVAAGEPSADGFVIWTRLAPKPLEPHGGMPLSAMTVVWEVSATADFATLAASGEAMARPELGHAVHVEVAGLSPDRPYHYRFRIAGHESRVGRARTLPAAGTALQRLRFVTAGCQRYDDGFFTAWRHIAEEDVAFVFHYGDYIYEYGNRVARERNRKIVRTLPPSEEEETYTLDDYRRRYAAYKLDPDLQAAHAAHAFLPSFDDHEVDSNWAAGESEEKGVTSEIFMLRRAAALQAWYESMPLRRASFPRGGGVLANRRFVCGDLLTLDVLDTRQHRSRQACGGGWKKDCAEVADPRRTMLGEAQERWLLDGLRSGPTRWSSVAQQVLMMRRDREPAPDVLEIATDKWDGFTAARDRVLAAVAARPERGFVVLSGDLHDHVAGVLKADFGDPASPTLGAEFLASSISSEGDGAPRSRLTDTYMANNPHFSLYNRQRGYIVNDLEAGGWTADFNVFDKVSVQGGQRSSAGRFRYDRAGRKLEKS